MKRISKYPITVRFIGRGTFEEHVIKDEEHLNSYHNSKVVEFIKTNYK